MKPRFSNQRTIALTLTAVLVVIAVAFALLIIAILPLAKEKAKTISGYSQLRAGGCAFGCGLVTTTTNFQWNCPPTTVEPESGLYKERSPKFFSLCLMSLTRQESWFVQLTAELGSRIGASLTTST
jgi:hypothetical protein